MKAHPAVEATCPLAAVDQRLADAHKLWHQAEAAYFDPDGFRLAVQNAIQSLRSVTFILQNHKAVIPNFTQWYGDYVDETRGKRGEWQNRLRADPLMRWMVEARNKIEKRGDLELIVSCARRSLPHTLMRAIASMFPRTFSRAQKRFCKTSPTIFLVNISGATVLCAYCGGGLKTLCRTTSC